MNKFLFSPIFFFVFFLLPACLSAQKTQDSVLYIIETIDGNKYVGTIVSEDDQTVRLKTKTIGEITIPREQINSMQTVKEAGKKKTSCGLKTLTPLDISSGPVVMASGKERDTIKTPGYFSTI